MSYPRPANDLISSGEGIASFGIWILSVKTSKKCKKEQCSGYVYTSLSYTHLTSLPQYVRCQWVCTHTRHTLTQISSKVIFCFWKVMNVLMSLDLQKLSFCIKLHIQLHFIQQPFFMFFIRFYFIHYYEESLNN